VFTVGKSTRGALGLGEDRLESLKFEQLVFPNAAKITKIASGDDFNIAVDENGKVFSWGYNRSGQLGHQNSYTTYKPAQLT
jgi:alpha-tubulin suppressor-like RCC1 family protein